MSTDSEGRRITLPDPTAGCCCTHHPTPLGCPPEVEYEPACPEHSVHVYNPRTGVWDLADTVTPASGMDRDDPLAVLAHYAGVPTEHLNVSVDSLTYTWKRARRLVRPDRHGGDRTEWDRVEAAAAALGLSS